MKLALIGAAARRHVALIIFGAGSLAMLAGNTAPAGCAGSSNTPGTGPISSGTGTAAKIVKTTQTLCQFAPTAATIAGVLTAAPAGATAEAIAEAICAAVAPLASGPGSSKTPGYAYGVRIIGREVP